MNFQDLLSAKVAIAFIGGLPFLGPRPFGIWSEWNYMNQRHGKKKKKCSKAKAEYLYSNPPRWWFISAATKIVFSVALCFSSFFIQICNADGPNCMQNGMGPSNLYQNGQMNPSYMWSKQGNQIYVPVVMDHAYAPKERKRILGGFKEIEQKTCIKFHYFNNHSIGNQDHVYVTKQRQGCWSYIGKIGGRQEMSLPRGCISHRTAVHEMIHALGFAHEHVRADRDNYITVNWGNIMPGRERNFVKRKTKSTDPYGPYDYGSIMHYDRNAFSFNRKETITPKKQGVRIGIDTRMSAWDQKKVNRMYHCSSLFEGGSGYGHGGYDYSNNEIDLGGELSNFIDDGGDEDAEDGATLGEVDENANVVADGPPSSHYDNNNNNLEYNPYESRQNNLDDDHDQGRSRDQPVHHQPTENNDYYDTDNNDDYYQENTNTRNRHHNHRQGRNRNNNQLALRYPETNYQHIGQDQGQEYEDSPAESEYSPQQQYQTSGTAQSSIFPTEFNVNSPEQLFQDCFPFCY